MEGQAERWLLCDFHIHTTLSDGELPLKKVVDLYGELGFDVISITDHVLDSKTLAERKRACELVRAIERSTFPQYLQLLKEAAYYAWKKYEMLLLPGAELTNQWKRYHILVIDIKEYIDPTLPVEEIVKNAHEQRAIVIAGHPCRKHGERNDSLHLWRRKEKYSKLFDAWEIANRHDLFNPVGVRKLRYVANSDFHELLHIFSWKSLIWARKNAESIKNAILENKVALYLLRDEVNPWKPLKTSYIITLLNRQGSSNLLDRRRT